MEIAVLGSNLTFILASALLAIFVILTCKTILPLLAERNRGKSFRKVVNSLQPHWLFGHLLSIQPNQETFLNFVSQTSSRPKIFQLWFGPFVNYLTLIHPHVLKPILSTAEPKDDFAYRFLRPWIGDGLLISSGKKWHRNRHLLTRAFHFDVLKEYVKVFNQCADVFMQKWKYLDDGTPVEIFDDVSRLTLDAILRCAISYDTGCQSQKSDHKYISAVYSLTRITMKRVFNPLCHNDFIFYLTPSGRKFKTACEYVHQYDEQVIRERKVELRCLLEQDDDSDELNVDDIARIAEVRRKNQQWLDFLDILLLTRDEDGKGLSDREIRDEVDTFLFEGHDTTASGISWALHCLAAYPKEQEKCREELLDVVGKKVDIEWSDLSKLTYMSLFIKEVLRLFPPVFSIGRRLANPLTFPRGFSDDQTCLNDNPINPETCAQTIPPPQNIGIHIFTLHRNESLWEDSSVFDPSRFEKQKVSKRSPFAYVPFSAGPRNCIGQNFALNEMKVVLSKILLQYRLYVDKECPKPEIMPMVVLKSANGIHIKFEKIHGAAD